MDGLSHNDISMETLQTSIVNAIKAIRSSKKRADELTYINLSKRNSINYKYGCKQHSENINRNGKNKNKPSKDKSSYFFSENNKTYSETYIPTIMAILLVETFTDIPSKTK